MASYNLENFYTFRKSRDAKNLPNFDSFTVILDILAVRNFFKFLAEVLVLLCLMKLSSSRMSGFVFGFVFRLVSGSCLVSYLFRDRFVFGLCLVSYLGS